MYKLWLGLWLVAVLSVNTVLADYQSMTEGHALFKQCTGCHGQAGERHALGKSLVINQMTKEQIVMSIEGYLDGTYGRSMKALMKGQVSRLSKVEIENIAAYVASLNDNKLKSLVMPPEPKNLPPVRKAQKYLPDSMKMKLKSKRYSNNLTSVKALVTHDSKTIKEANDREVKQYYLTKVVFKEDEQTILEIKSTPYLSRNPIFKFKYQSYGGKRLSFIAYNNFGKRAEKSVVIQDKTSIKKVGSLEPNVRNKMTTSINHLAIREYLGDIKLIESDKIQLIGPDVANGSSVPITVRSTIKAKRVTLFAMEEKGKTKMLVEWILHQQTLVDFALYIKLVNYAYHSDKLLVDYDENVFPGNVVSAVVEGTDGKFYVSNIRVQVSIGGGDQQLLRRFNCHVSLVYCRCDAYND